jgi:PAS domain S-box-containing protein
MLVSVLKSATQCKLCWRVALYVILSVIAVEAVILIPSYRNYERDLLLRLEHTGLATVSAAYLGNSHATNRDLILVGKHLVRQKMMAGGALYGIDGGEIGQFGEIPALTPRSGAVTRRSDNGDWYDVFWPAEVLDVPFSVAARLDARWIATELQAFLWRIIGLVLLISTVVCAATMAIVGRKILSPLLSLRSNLLAASEDPANVDKYTMAIKSDDELGEVIDTTNRLLEQVAKAHRDSLWAMTAMADQAADAIIAYDLSGQILYANRSCLEICGISTREEMQKMELPKVLFNDSTDPVNLPESLAGGAYSREAILIGNAGIRLSVVVNAARVPRSSRSTVRFYASITDISQLLQAQEKLEEQNMELVAANRAKSEFLANMSHELRTPLNAIIGFSELLANGSLGPTGNERFAEYAQDINNSGTFLLRIINDILDLSKIEAGRMELFDTEFNVLDAVDSVIILIQERAREKALELVVSIDKKLPALRADDRAVKQMLINLLSNAVKFTEPGGKVAVTARLEQGAMEFTVSDTGVGMSPDDIEVALKPFQQVDGSLAREYEGTGLGLPLVKSMIELHDGHLRIDSAVGKGTTVTLHFPIARTVASTEKFSTETAA